ncbi:type II secretion system protein GspD [Novilysobacter spongiicola]|uniref:General secretion pathway protein D n=1 Tax=Lysobacter spongiicola DSM 21749 TaxID=1122188 RepID=A0A1T4PEJ4_9GAMM|nr:type II secretion system protein GspD [Lysobacter spongiicola]SJZ90003.1 general secretion pathway protein D [Lysobacter spongiicola DSM 21749]
MKRFLLLAFAVVLLGHLNGCARPVKVSLPEPVPRPEQQVPSPPDQALVAGEGVDRPDSLVRTATPSLSQSGSAVSGLRVTEDMPPVRGEPIAANIEGVPVPAFINEFFGSILGVGFQMDPAVAKLNDLVTLRTPGPLPPEEFYQLAVQVLKTYGIRTRYEGGRVMFTPAAKGGDFEPPLVLSGRTLPQVPITHRPIFQLVELQAVRTGDVSQWLKTAFDSDGLRIQDDLNRNAIVLYGKPDIVQQAVAAIRVLDRPYMRGRVSTRLEPAFVAADELGRRLVDVLVAEGYGASLHSGQGVVQATSVLVLPVVASNTVLLFAGDAELLDHAVQWAHTIDRPNPASGSQSLFYYMVKNTQAQDIVATLNGVRTAAARALEPTRDALSSGEANSADGRGAAAPATPAASGGAATGSLADGQLVLDEPRNALIFQGEAAAWGRLLPLIRQMDRAARQVMIEVTIAEVSLEDNEEFGVSWLAKNDIGRFNGTVTSGILGDSDAESFGGLTYLLDIAGQARARLRAFADDSRVTILSSPRLMVKSGEEASIDVGTEVPTISAQTASDQQTDGTSNILQSVQYRKTGIILNIKPIVYSDDRIDLTIRQEVSEALPLSADSTVQSPSIFNRAVSSSLSLRDGSSILIGGLMSNRTTNSDGGVPYLKDIPVLGNLFRNSTRRSSRTELVLMIVPYVVETDAQARELSQSLGKGFQHIEMPNGRVPLDGVEQAPPAPQTQH